MHEYLTTAKAVALEAGALMLESFGLATVYTLKEDYSPVTETDRRINDMVIARLENLYPEHSFLGEEGEKMNGSDYVWVFDPIDGTVPYLRGIPTNMFSLALVKAGEPILGVVYDPHQKRLYSAVKGQGAFLNDKSLSTSTATAFAQTYVETDHHRGFSDLALFERMRDVDIRFLSYSSTVYGHMLVASGQIEGAIIPGKKPWDVAAAKIIIEEAGGTTSDIRGNAQRYDREVKGFVAACTPEYHTNLLALIAPSLFPH